MNDIAHLIHHLSLLAFIYSAYPSTKTLPFASLSRFLTVWMIMLHPGCQNEMNSEDMKTLKILYKSN
ncbi:MAG: hypothetical protein ACKO96_22160, partial [Flammeovirgaceae bacterium]